MRENGFDRPPSHGASNTEAPKREKEKTYDYRSDLEKHFERKGFFNDGFSREDLQKLFVLLINYDNSLEKIFASKNKFELLSEFNFKSKDITKFLLRYLKGNGDVSNNNYEIIGKNGSNIDSSLDLLENYHNSLLDYSRQDEYENFIAGLDKPSKKQNQNLDRELNILYKRLRDKNIKKKERGELQREIDRVKGELEIFNSSEMGSNYSLEDLELANQMRNAKDSKDDFLKDKLNLYRDWKKYEAGRYNLKGINRVLKEIKKGKRKEENSDRFYENKSDFYNKDETRLEESLYFDELQDYWLKGEYKRKDKLRGDKYFKGKKKKGDRTLFLEAVDIKRPFKILEFTVNYELKHIDFTKDRLLKADPFFNKENNFSKKDILKENISAVTETFQAEWALLQEEMKNVKSSEDNVLESVDFAAFLKKWFSNQRPFGKLLDLSYLLRKITREKVRNDNRLNKLNKGIQSILVSEPLKEKSSELKDPEKLVKEIPDKVASVEARVAEDRNEDANGIEAAKEKTEVKVESTEKTADWYKEKIKLTKKIQDYLITRAAFLGNNKTVKEQINEIEDLVLLETLYNVSQR